MRHQVKGRKLGRTTPHRKATLQALSVALIKEQRIQTTLPKAKELRTFIEPIITKAKEDTTHNRRQVFSKLRDKYAVTELFDNVIPAVGDRPGGYTRVLKLGNRLGDSAQMAVIELVDFNDVKPETVEKKKKRTRRAGKSNKPNTQDEETKAKSDDKAGDQAEEKKTKAKSKKKAKKEQPDEKSEAKPKKKAKKDEPKEKTDKPKTDKKKESKSKKSEKKEDTSASKKKASKADVKKEESKADKSAEDDSSDKEEKS